VSQGASALAINTTAQITCGTGMAMTNMVDNDTCSLNASQHWGPWSLTGELEYS